MVVRRKTILISAAVVLLLVVGAYSGLLLESGGLTGISINDDTREFCRSYRGLGGFSLESSDQIFDSDIVRMAWTDSGSSEKVGVSGAIETCQFISTENVDDVRYVFFISTPDASDYTNTPETLRGETDKYSGERDGRKWDLFRFPSDVGDFNAGEVRYSCAVYTCRPELSYRTVFPHPTPFKIEGRQYTDAAGREKDIYDGSVLRVELHISISLLFNRADWQLVAVDEARIRAAPPNANFDKAGYRVGETARLCWDIPFDVVDDEPAYYLSVLEGNGRLPVKDSGGNVLQRTPISGLTGCVSIPIVAAMYRATEPCSNSLVASVYSPILKVEESQTSVRPSAALSSGAAPGKPDIDFDKSTYNKGDIVRVTLRSSGAVTKWEVSAHVEGTEALPITTYEDSDGVLTVSFTAPNSGKLEVMARAYNGCVPSDTATASILVGRERQKFCDLNPEDPYCTAVDSWLWLILIIAGAVLLLIALAIPFPLIIRIVLLGAGVIVILIGYLSWTGAL